MDERQYLDRPSRRRVPARLLRWFDAHRRPLPWRRNHDPYRVWISEIMLQQTRVAAVIEYYERFLKRFPEVGVLARAREASVLAVWSGLGYYRRARLLHRAAKEIARGGGRFPADAAGWLRLPGIGRYTAAAVASICYGECCAVVDGNVRRVLARLFGRKPDDPWQAAAKLLSRSRPGDANQALMELGALVCTARAPRCDRCPLAECCAWAVSGNRKPKSGNGSRRDCVKLAYALVTRAGRVFLVRRGGDATVMPGMWELPQATSQQDQAGSQAFMLRHTIMNTYYHITVVRGQAARSAVKGAGEWFTAARLAKLPLTGLARKILRRSGIIASSR